MNVTVKTFAQLREITQEGNFTLTLPDSTVTMGDVITLLKSRSEKWAQALGASADSENGSVLMARNQQLCRVDRELAPESYALDSECDFKALDVRIARADAVIISDYGKGFVDDELFTILRGEAKFLAVDPKPRRTVRYGSPDLMTPNRSESLQLAGLEKHDFEDFPAQTVVEAIHKTHGPRLLAITLGSDGMFLAEGGEVFRHIPTAAREVFDVSGAGDTVISALTLALAAEASLEEAATFANLAAGVVVGKVGTASASPEEILKAMSQA